MQEEKRYKLRHLTTNKEYGDVMGMTIKREIAQQFQTTTFRQYISGNAIILDGN